MRRGWGFAGLAVGAAVVAGASPAMARGGSGGHTHVVGYIIYSNGSPTPAMHSPRPAMSAETLKDLQRPALTDDGKAPVVASGMVRKGQAFMTVGVRHTFTGVLAGEVKAKGWFTNAKAAAGTPVFGLPMGGPDGPGIVWCAPQRRTDRKAPEPWTAVCLPYGDASNVWIKAEPALLPLSLTWDDKIARGAQAPDVTRGPADLPAMTLSYVFDGWDERGWLLVRETIDWGDGPEPLRSIALPADAQGVASVKLMGGRLALTRPAATTADQAMVAQDAPPRAGQPVVF